MGACPCEDSGGPHNSVILVDDRVLLCRLLGMTWIYSSSDALIGRGWGGGGWEMPAVVGGGLCLYDWKRRPPLSSGA